MSDCGAEAAVGSGCGDLLSEKTLNYKFISYFFLNPGTNLLSCGPLAKPAKMLAGFLRLRYKPLNYCTLLE